MKKTLRRYTHLICVVFGLLACNQQQEEQAMPSTDTSLLSLTAEARLSIFSHDGFEKARMLRHEATKQNNDSCVALAYKYMLLTALNTEQKDSITFFADQAKYYFGKSDMEEEIFGIETSLIEWEMMYGNTNTALEKAKTLLAKIQNNKNNEFHVYGLISDIYNMMGEWDQAESAFLQMLDIRNKYRLNLHYQMPYVFLRGAQLETSMRKYNEALIYCDSAQVYINKYHKKRDNKTLLTLLNMNKVSIFIQLGRLDEAKASLDTLDIITEKKESDIYYYYIQSTRAKYYRGKGDYKTALSYIEPVVTKFKETNNKTGYHSAMQEKIEILALNHNYKDAFELQSEHAQYTDSIALADAHRQLNELQTIYQVDKLKNNAEQDALKIKNTQQLVIFLTIICILLLATAILMMRNAIVLKRKNRKLFSQYNEQDEQQEKIQKIILSKRDEASQLSLFERAETLLNETKAYCDPTITRESLAMELGTNRQYLTQAIQENKNMTFMEYINDYRLNYSRRLLSHSAELSIDDIYMKVGFNNKSTFYRLFKQKYELTPKEFQNIAIKDRELPSQKRKGEVIFHNLFL